MPDKEKRKTMAEALYRVNVSPLPVMPLFDKDLIMKRIEDPPLEDNEGDEKKGS